MTHPSEAKELRGFILCMCKVAFPEGCSDRLIEMKIKELQFESSPAMLKYHLEYLEEKGYVRLEERHVKDMGIGRLMVYATAKGIDLVEGNIPLDPGITILEREL